MCNKGVIHVFIGAPSFPCGPVSECHPGGWKDITFGHDIQNGKNQQISADQGLDGASCEESKQRESAPNDLDVLGERPGTSGEPGDLGERPGTSGEPGDLGEWPATSGDLGERPGTSGDLGERPGTSGDPGDLGERPGTSGDLGEWPGTSGDLGERPGTSGEPGDLGERPGTSGEPGDLGERPGTSGDLGERPGTSGEPISLGEWPGTSGHPGPDLDANLIGIISDLVSSTELCHITQNPHRPSGKESDGPYEYLGEAQDPNIRSDGCTTVSAETEFITILTSSQLSIKRPETHRTTTGHHPTHRAKDFVTQGALLENITTESAFHDSFTCSSDLFTHTFDEVIDDKPLTAQKSENALLHSKGETAVEITNNVDNLGSASSKRKKGLSGFYTSSKHNPQYKKCKQSLSPVKCDEHQQQTPAKSLTLLKHCSDKSKLYNIMVVVLQPCHVKEIKVKSGPNIGSTLPLADIVVMDQSEVKYKVLMWRTAAFWSLALLPGEIIVLTNLSVCEDRWREDLLLQSTFRSQLVNLGNCSTLLSRVGSHTMENCAQKELLDYIEKKHYYLCELSPRQPQRLEHIQYVSLAELQPELLVHAILKVNNISILKESTYHFKGLQQNKIILTVEQVKGKTSILVLWGTCVLWCEQIHLKRNHIWVFKYLFCKNNIILGDLELHTTPWSSCECLFDDDQRAIDFRTRYNISSEKQMSLLTMIEERYSGEIQVKGSISQLEFQIPGQGKILVNHETSISDILKFLPDIIYIGCGKCQRELHIDDNHVYEQCYICLPFNQVRSFYRSAQMTIMSDECCVCLLVPPDIVGNVFLNISPYLLPKVFPSCKDVTYGTILADLCHSLLAQTGESFVFTIKSQFMLDENSIPLEEDFYLLDFHLDL